MSKTRINSPSESPSKSLTPKRITGRTVLFGMLAFFGVIMVVNAIFVYFAIISWPDLVSKQAYKEGLDYNKTLIEAQHQKDLAWSVALGLNAGDLTASFFDKNKSPLVGLTLKATIKRPVEDIPPIIVFLQESPLNPGDYDGPVNFPLLGRWSVMLEASQDNRDVYRMEYEIMVK